MSDIRLSKKERIERFREIVTKMRNPMNSAQAPGKPEPVPPDYGKDFFLEIVKEWKFFWMKQTQNSQADFENYYRRAFGIDANMQHDLANRLSASVEQLLREAQAEAFEECRPVLEAAYEVACLVQSVKDGNYEGEDYFGRLRALRHAMFCGPLLNKIAKAEAARKETP